MNYDWPPTIEKLPSTEIERRNKLWTKINGKINLIKDNLSKIDGNISSSATLLAPVYSSMEQLVKMCEDVKAENQKTEFSDANEFSDYVEELGRSYGELRKYFLQKNSTVADFKSQLRLQEDQETGAVAKLQEFMEKMKKEQGE